MANVSDAPWDGSASHYPDTPSYCDACFINTNIGPRQNWVQAKCKLPYKTPAGAISRAGVHAAAAAIAGAHGNDVNAPAGVVRAAARKLVSVYDNDLNEDPPPSLLEKAGLPQRKH